jgi:hypothetical protein
MSNTKSKRTKSKGRKTSAKKTPTKRRRRKSHSKHHGFFGTPAKSGKKMTLKDTLVEVGKYVLFVAGGSMIGAAIGKPSLYLGLPVAVYAFYKKHHMLGAAAVAAMFTPVVVAPTGTSGYDDMEGFDIKKFESDAKARLTTYFKSIGEKFYLPKPKSESTTALKLQTVTGLNGNEEVSYFINPNNMGEAPDMSSLDKISENIAKLSAGGSTQVTGYDEEAYLNL